MQIEGSDGAHLGVKVNGNQRIYTSSITRTEPSAALDIGNSYNLNTGTMTFTADSALGAVYLENNETQNLHIDAIAVAMGYVATQDQQAVMTLVRNPTGGTVKSEQFVTGIMNKNRNFGSSKTLNVDFYIADGDGKTITGGDDIAQFFLNSNSRAFFSIDFELTKGSSLGINIVPPDDSSNTFYIALICHLKDANE